MRVDPLAGVKGNYQTLNRQSPLCLLREAHGEVPRLKGLKTLSDVHEAVVEICKLRYYLVTEEVSST